jgi:hypothetical protein
LSSSRLRLLRDWRTTGAALSWVITNEVVVPNKIIPRTTPTCSLSFLGGQRGSSQNHGPSKTR